MAQISRDFGRKAGRLAAWGAAAAAALLVQACTETRAPDAGPAPRYYHADLQGAAKSCTVSVVKPVPSKTNEVTMDVANDGGWCNITVANDGAPYNAGLLTARAEHGSVYVHTVGNGTRIDYTPNRGYIGTDSFTVTLLPGTSVLHTAVTVKAK